MKIDLIKPDFNGTAKNEYLFQLAEQIQVFINETNKEINTIRQEIKKLKEEK